jgi:K+-transporting ATPase ATPase C chain
MLQHLRPAFVLIVLFSALTGLVYPQITMPYHANGSLIEKDGAVVGSALIGQWLKSDRYFHPRPSATTDTDPNDSSKTIGAPYDRANSSGSNFVPHIAKACRPGKGRRRGLAHNGRLRPGSRRRYHDLRLRARSAHLASGRPGPGRFGRKSARAAGRSRARACGGRGRAPFFGLIAEPRVNVLLLNLALDRLKSS